MSDRTNVLTVALEWNMKSEEVEPIVAAIRQLRGVLAVEVNEVRPDTWAAGQQVKYDLQKKIFDVLL